ncbi:MAG: alpha/beta fold hydrolase [Roseiflexaceae bacterium]|nr:alpha/beta fold hydrolase [Roseiflexaceae bacterium]
MTEPVLTSVIEEVFVCGDGHQLIGILSYPATRPDDDLPTVIMLNAGLLHRVGPNRVYVTIARALAARGFPVLRLDLAGIGESSPHAETMPMLDSVLADVRIAMAALAEQRGAQRFLLLGHCSGGIASLVVAEREPQIVGAVMINPEGVNQEWDTFDKQRKVATYYANFYGRNALANSDRLRRFLTGRADYRTIIGNLFKHLIWNRIAAFLFRTRKAIDSRTSVGTGANTEREQARAMLKAVGERGTSLLFIFTEGSTGYDYVRMIAGDEIDRLCANGVARVEILQNADHIFNLLSSQQRLVEVIGAWVTGVIPTLSQHQ